MPDPIVQAIDQSDNKRSLVEKAVVVRDSRIASGDFIEEGIPATTHEKVALHIKTAHDAIGEVKMSLEDQDIDGAVHHLMAQKNGAKTETLAAMNTLLDAIKLARTTDTDTNTSGFNN
jgi:hypothetical protein